MFLVNSRLSHFSVTPGRSGRKAHHLQEHPFFRSYGANWSSSLRVDHPSALEYSSRPPVSVYGTDTIFLTRGFSWQYGIRQFVSPEGFTLLGASALCNPDLPGLRPERLDCHPIGSCPILLRHPIVQTVDGGTGIFVPAFHRLRLSASA
jgi:hypothetical protein